MSVTQRLFRPSTLGRGRRHETVSRRSPSTQIAVPNGDGLCVSHYVAKYGRPPVDVGWPLPGSELLSKVMAALAESNAARHIFCPSSNYIEYDNGKQFEDPVKYVPPQKEDWLTRKMNAPFEKGESVLNFNVAST